MHQAGPGIAGGTGRSLHESRGFRRAECPSGRTRQQDICKSTQRGSRITQAAGCPDHGQATVDVFRLCLGQRQCSAGGHAGRGDQSAKGHRFRDQPAHGALQRNGRACGSLSPDRGKACYARLRHRRRCLQGERSRPPGQARVPLDGATVGNLAQVPRRTCLDAVGSDRHPGGSNRRAFARGEVAAGHRRRRGRVKCHPSQRGLHRRARRERQRDQGRQGHSGG